MVRREQGIAAAVFCDRFGAMADYELEEALLEAAGRPKEGGGRSHTPSSNKRRRASSMSSDDRSDSSPDNDDEDDDDDFDERGGGRSGEQAKGSKMPLKKRYIFSFASFKIK